MAQKKNTKKVSKNTPKTSVKKVIKSVKVDKKSTTVTNKAKALFGKLSTKMFVATSVFVLGISAIGASLSGLNTPNVEDNDNQNSAQAAVGRGPITQGSDTAEHGPHNICNTLQGSGSQYFDSETIYNKAYASYGRINTTTINLSSLSAGNYEMAAYFFDTTHPSSEEQSFEFGKYTFSSGHVFTGTTNSDVPNANNENVVEESVSMTITGNETVTFDHGSNYTTITPYTALAPTQPGYPADVHNVESVQLAICMKPVSTTPPVDACEDPDANNTGQPAQCLYDSVCKDSTALNYLPKYADAKFPQDNTKCLFEGDVACSNASWTVVVADLALGNPTSPNIGLVDGSNGSMAVPVGNEYPYEIIMFDPSHIAGATDPNQVHEQVRINGGAYTSDLGNLELQRVIASGNIAGGTVFNVEHYFHGGANAAQNNTNLNSVHTMLCVGPEIQNVCEDADATNTNGALPCLYPMWVSKTCADTETRVNPDNCGTINNGDEVEFSIGVSTKSPTPITFDATDVVYWQNSDGDYQNHNGLTNQLATPMTTVEGTPYQTTAKYTWTQQNLCGSTFENRFKISSLPAGISEINYIDDLGNEYDTAKFTSADCIQDPKFSLEKYCKVAATQPNKDNLSAWDKADNLAGACTLDLANSADKLFFNLVVKNVGEGSGSVTLTDNSGDIDNVSFIGGNISENVVLDANGVFAKAFEANISSVQTGNDFNRAVISGVKDSSGNALTNAQGMIIDQVGEGDAINQGTAYIKVEDSRKAKLSLKKYCAVTPTQPGAASAAWSDANNDAGACQLDTNSNNKLWFRLSVANTGDATGSATLVDNSNDMAGISFGAISEVINIPAGETYEKGFEATTDSTNLDKFVTNSAVINTPDNSTIIEDGTGVAKAIITDSRQPKFTLKKYCYVGENKPADNNLTTSGWVDANTAEGACEVDLLDTDSKLFFNLVVSNLGNTSGKVSLIDNASDLADGETQIADNFNGFTSGVQTDLLAPNDSQSFSFQVGDLLAAGSAANVAQLSNPVFEDGSNVTNPWIDDGEGVESNQGIAYIKITDTRAAEISIEKFCADEQGSVVEEANCYNKQIGDKVYFGIVVKNEGNIAAENVVVTDTLPENDMVSSEDDLTYDLGTLAAGATADTIVITTTVLKEGESINTASVTTTTDEEGDNPEGIKPNTATAPVSAFKVQHFDIATTKTAPESIYTIGDEFEYTITVANIAEDSDTHTAITATGVRLEDNLPTGLKAVDGEDQIRVEIGDLAPGESEEIKIKVVVTDKVELIKNIVCAKYSQPLDTSSLDSNIDNDCSFYDIKTIKPGELVLTKTCTQGGDKETCEYDLANGSNQTTEFIIKVANVGEADIEFDLSDNDEYSTISFENLTSKDTIKGGETKEYKVTANVVAEGEDTNTVTLKYNGETVTDTAKVIVKNTPAPKPDPTTTTTGTNLVRTGSAGRALAVIIGVTLTAGIGYVAYRGTQSRGSKI